MSTANFLHYAMRRFDGTLHPAVPAGRMLAGKKNSAFPARVHKNKAEFAGTEC